MSSMSPTFLPRSSRYPCVGRRNLAWQEPVSISPVLRSRWQWDIIPLLGLALFSALATLTRSQGPRDSVVLSGSAGGVFLAETAVSTLLSVDIGRSLRLGMQLLPAVLLFFLVTEHFDGPRDIRLLYLTFSMLGIVLASRMLWVAWHANGTINLRVTRLGIPLLVDPNDLTFLAIIAPLSFLYSSAAKHARPVPSLLGSPSS